VGQWHLARARFQLGLENYRAEPRVLTPEVFTLAEASFHGLRAQDPSLAESALGYELVCRLARGWCAFAAGDLASAAEEFLAMNELQPRGVEWALPGELESGIQGLFLVADAHRQRDEKLAAGEVFETLRGLQSEFYGWANNAGFFLRDAALDLEEEGVSYCRALRGALTNPEALAELRQRAGVHEVAGSQAERDAFQRVAEERFARARELMERSWAAYRSAAELAPEDVRVLNDAALVQVCYLHRELDWAERTLLRCVELGGQQLADKRSALASEESPERAQALESELEQLTEAVGDAHQNLGVLAWLHKKDAPAARTWLEQALALWPNRPPVVNSLLPQVLGELQPEAFDHWDLLNWAQSCPLR
jgi:tetratricopeptide (TPR) repeat protein